MVGAERMETSVSELDVGILRDALLAQGGGTASIRLDQVPGFDAPDGGTGAYVDLLSELAQERALTENGATIIMAIPVSVTEEICTLGPASLDFESDDDDCPTVYRHHGDDFLIEADEEYRKVIPTGSDLNALFRSWRDAQAAEHGWEFNNFVFLWTSPPKIGV